MASVLTIAQLVRHKLLQHLNIAHHQIEYHADKNLTFYPFRVGNEVSSSTVRSNIGIFLCESQAGLPCMPSIADSSHRYEFTAWSSSWCSQSSCPSGYTSLPMIEQMHVHCSNSQPCLILGKRRFLFMGAFRVLKIGGKPRYKMTTRGPC
jgi:hypothetical protein